METVIFVAGDYHVSTINLYFVAAGPVSKTQAAQFASLAGCSPPTDQEFENMREFYESPQLHFCREDGIRDGTDHRGGGSTYAVSTASDGEIASDCG